MISVVAPVYAVEKYLPQCVESLLRQSYRELQIILVDDGSPDRCPQICDEYARKDSRVVVVHQRNAGVSAARNAGLKLADGELVAFVDPDDWIASDMYEKMSDALELSHADLAICGYEYCEDDGTVNLRRQYKRRETEFLTQKEVMKRASDIPPTIRHAVFNKLFRKTLISSLVFREDLRASEDVWFLTEYLLKSRSAVFLHEPYYFNRVRQGSATHGGLSIQDLERSFQAHEFMRRSVVERYPDLKDYSQRFLLDVFLLKYNEAKEKRRALSKEKKAEALRSLRRMRAALRNEAWKALLNRDVYWKTRLAYLLVR